MAAAEAPEHGVRLGVTREACGVCGQIRSGWRVASSLPADARPMAVAPARHIGIGGPGVRLEVVCELSCSSQRCGGASNPVARGTTLSTRSLACTYRAIARTHVADKGALPRRSERLRARTARGVQSPASVSAGARKRKRRTTRPGLAGACGCLCNRRRAWAGSSRGICHARNARDGPGPRVPRFGCNSRLALALCKLLAHLSHCCMCPACTCARWGTFWGPQRCAELAQGPLSGPL